MNSYVYSPLRNGEIRLITLLPGAFNEAISFGLTHKKLDPTTPTLLSKRLSKDDLQRTLVGNWKVFETPDGRYIFWPGSGVSVRNEHPDPHFDPSLYAPDDTSSEPGLNNSYEALSYVWGTIDDLETAYICPPAEGLGDTGRMSASAVVEIGTNLAIALRYLRYPEKQRTLWVDAICINQRDIKEREMQVPRMGSIYSRANRVVAWIGTSENESDLALSALKYLAQQVEMSIDRWIFRSASATEPEWWRSSYLLPYSQETEKALTAFYNRPWFERLWTMQEIRLGSCRSVAQLGDQEIDWSIIQRATRALAGRVGLPHELREGIQSSMGFTQEIAKITLPELLRTSRVRKSSDARDKVYGILSLAPPVFARRIRPHYSLSAARTYKDVFLHSVEILHRLDLLPQSGSPRADFEGPSWVPDWAERVMWRLPMLSGFQATGISRPHYCYNDGSEVLEVLGVYCTTVHSVIEPTLDNSARMFGTIDPIELRAKKYPTGESLLQAYARLVQLDRGAERSPMDGSIPKLATFTQEFPKNLSCSWSHRMLGTFSEEPSLPSKFLQTGSELCGFGQSNVQQGDIVCVFLGCSVPMILRDNMNGHFTVVGPAYIQGIMDGEALLGPIPQPWLVQQIQHDGMITPRYFNTTTDSSTLEDPRLEALDFEWERLLPLRNRTADDPFCFAEFRSRVTGEVMNSDPRLLPEALKRRGVNLQTFPLI